VVKKRVSILTTEDSAPLRSRAIRRLVGFWLATYFMTLELQCRAFAAWKGA